MTRGAAIAVSLAVLFVAGCSDDTASVATVATTATTVAPGQALADLAAGDCLPDLPTAAVDRTETVSCDSSHRAEVFATDDFDQEQSFPGAGRLSGEAALRCSALYEAYAGEPVDPTTDQAFAEVVPSEASWADGDRRTICLALPPAGASVEGSIAEAA